MRAGGEALALFVVQASSRSWKGAPDPCLSELDGRPAVEWTLRRIADALPATPLRLVAPEFDRGGAFEPLRLRFDPARFAILYGHDDDPLARLLAAAEGLPSEALLARCDALHCFFDLELTLAMAERAMREGLDCVKPPDDFPAQLGSEVFRVGALRRLAERLGPDPTHRALRVHPKHAFAFFPGAFRWATLDSVPAYSEAQLRRWRERARELYRAPRQEAEEPHRLAPGDQSLFHYELARRHLVPGGRLLEAACGDGAGARLLARCGHQVVAVDRDRSLLRRLARHATGPRLRFLAANVTRLPFPSQSFDAATCIETIEHVAAGRCLAELRRVLVPGGRLVLSTPQNAFGRIPLNPHHRREFSLEEITALCARHFQVVERIGIKAGRVVVPGDPRGHNTVLFLRKHGHADGTLTGGTG